MRSSEWPGFDRELARRLPWLQTEMRSGLRWGGVSLISLLLAIGVAHGDKRSSVEKLAADAAAAYHVADYARAVKLLEEAYLAEPLSALLYNLAKAYDKLGETQKALDLYQRYAAAADADPKLKAKAEARALTLHELRRRAESRATDAPPPLLAPLPVPEVQPLGPDMLLDATADDLRLDERARRAHLRRRDRIVAFSTTGAGVVALGVAIGLSVNALLLHDDFGTIFDEEAKRSLRDSARTQALSADILYAVGAVTVGVGAYFFYRGYRRIRSSPSAVMRGWFGGQSAGLVCEGRF